MAKKFYLVKKISKDKYLELMKEAGYRHELAYLNHSVSGSAPLKKGKKQYAAYTSDNGLEVLLDDKE